MDENEKHKLTVKNTEASKIPTEKMSPLLFRWTWGDTRYTKWFVKENSWSVLIRSSVILGHRLTMEP